MITWITIKLMKLQLKRIKKQKKFHSNSIVRQALDHAIKSYKNTIDFLNANRENTIW